MVQQQVEYEIEGIGGDRDTQLFDNDDTVPEDWGNFDMDGLTVNDGHDSNWVYNQIEIQSGQLFHDKKHLQHAVKK